MKRQPGLLTICLFLAGTFLFISPGCSTSKKTASVSDEAMKHAIEADNWIFRADYALPQGARSRHLTSIYEVTNRKDTVIFFLPYFGRAYTAPVGETTSPLNFKTTDFDLNKTSNNKGKWEVTVRPKDNREVQSCNFTLFENGSGQLNVQMTNRSSISFNGTVRPGK
ncbi:MAG: DUF4251 domain-containing protein [Chitinophagaceae bacterium]|nr:DUF4251 domain-containing protein [Chitinophagaceae bacterium]